WPTRSSPSPAGGRRSRRPCARRATTRSRRGRLPPPCPGTPRGGGPPPTPRGGARWASPAGARGGGPPTRPARPGRGLARRSRRAWKELAEEFPKEPSYREGLAETQEMRAFRFGHTGRYAESEAAYREVIDLRRKLADESDAKGGHRTELARALTRLGELLIN